MTDSEREQRINELGDAMVCAASEYARGVLWQQMRALIFQTKRSVAVRSPSELLAEIKAMTLLGEIGLSEIIGVSQPTIHRILRGQSNCSSKVLIAIQRVHAELMAEK